MTSNEQAHLTGLVCIAEQDRMQRLEENTIRSHVVRSLLSQVALPEDVLPKSSSGDQEYFQINTEWGSGQPWLSRSLGDNQLPFKPQELASAEFWDQKYDFSTLPSGRPVRRITFKVSANPAAGGGVRPRNGGPLPPRPDGNRAGGAIPPPPRNPPRDRRPEASAPW